MKIHKVVSEKLIKIMIERNISVNKLASINGLAQSTVDHLFNVKPKLNDLP